MLIPDEKPTRPLRFTLKGVGCFVVVVGFCSAFIPGAALFVVGAAPVAIGFIVLVIGEEQNRDWVTILGATLMAVGLGIGALLMSIAQRIGE